jgi:hypothetical protein
MGQTHPAATAPPFWVTTNVGLNPQRSRRAEARFQFVTFPKSTSKLSKHTAELRDGHIDLAINEWSAHGLRTG